MAKTLGGATFIWKGEEQDYCYKEAIRCLLELCDEVAIVCGGDDGTYEGVQEAISGEECRDKTVQLCTINQNVWDSQQGREKISYFMNMALTLLSTDWAFSLQADEIIAERSFPHIRAAIEWNTDSFVAFRYNLWRDPLSMLDVEQSRKPCSTEVIRLAKTQYRAYNDGEHLACPTVEHYPKPIEVYHMGFIRDPVKHVVKAKNVLVDIFGFEMDKRFGDKFDYRNFPFEGNDIIPVPLPLPKFIQKWCEERYPELKITPSRLE